MQQPDLWVKTRFPPAALQLAGRNRPCVTGTWEIVKSSGKNVTVRTRVKWPEGVKQDDHKLTLVDNGTLKLLYDDESTLTLKRIKE